MCNMCGNLIIGLCWTKCSAECSITDEIFALIWYLTVLQHFLGKHPFSFSLSPIATVPPPFFLSGRVLCTIH